jgi:hypothetical protein
MTTDLSKAMVFRTRAIARLYQKLSITHWDAKIISLEEAEVLFILET